MFSNCSSTCSRSSTSETVRPYQASALVRISFSRKAFKCDVCGKMFLLQWRLEKHGNVHTIKTRKCKFFLNKEPCPFSDIGCKFVHDHNQDDDIESIEDDDYNINENQCHLCKLQLSTRDEVMDHVEAEHKDYFQGVLEYAATIRT